mmetsp:Transcript_1085/g.3059  ORF Transcript_1085/g.3059 Transcript_1085/m.3059 type:complete len:234 (-) Transcript_1085:102-803(-)
MLRLSRKRRRSWRDMCMWPMRMSAAMTTVVRKSSHTACMHSSVLPPMAVEGMDVSSSMGVVTETTVSTANCGVCRGVKRPTTARRESTRTRTELGQPSSGSRGPSATSRTRRASAAGGSQYSSRRSPAPVEVRMLPMRFESRSGRQAAKTQSHMVHSSSTMRRGVCRRLAHCRPRATTRLKHANTMQSAVSTNVPSLCCMNMAPTPAMARSMAKQQARVTKRSAKKGARLAAR